MLDSESHLCEHILMNWKNKFWGIIFSCILSCVSNVSMIYSLFKNRKIYLFCFFLFLFSLIVLKRAGCQHFRGWTLTETPLCKGRRVSVSWLHFSLWPTAPVVDLSHSQPHCLAGSTPALGECLCLPISTSFHQDRVFGRKVTRWPYWAQVTWCHCLQALLLPRMEPHLKMMSPHGRKKTWETSRMGHENIWIKPYLKPVSILNLVI